MLDTLFSPQTFPSAFAVLVLCYVCLKLADTSLPAPGRRSGPRVWREDRAGRAEEVRELLELARQAPSREIQIAAIQTLGERRVRESLPLLGKLLRSDDPLVASEAANSLGAIGDPSALAYLEEAVSALDEELQQGFDSVASGSTDSATSYSGRPAWERILPQLARSNFRAFDRYTPHDVRTRSEPEVLEMLLDMASSPREPVANRYHALKNLELFRGPDIGPRILPLLSDEHTTIRYTTAELLALHGSEDSVAALVKTLMDRNRFVRSSAAMTLAVLGSDRAIAPLLKLEEDPDEVVRYSAQKALTSIGRKKRIASLLTRRRRVG